jgi:uncharacterized membrane protein
MFLNGIYSFFRNEFKTITIEPIIFLNAFGISTVMGAQVSQLTENPIAK